LRDLVEVYGKKIKQAGIVQAYLDQGKSSVFGIPSSSHSFIASSLFKSKADSKSIVVISPLNFEAEFLYRESLSYLEHGEAFYFPGPEIIPYEYSKYSSELKRDRIRVLSKIIQGERILTFTSVSGFLRSIPDAVSLKKKSFVLRKKQVYSPEILIKKLVELGYKREEKCEKFGDFSVKGSIIDLFTSLYDDPLRLDFLGDTLDEIKLFDPSTQRSTGDKDEITVLPCDEISLSEGEKKIYFDRIDKFADSFKKPDGIIEELIFLEKKASSLLDFFSQSPIILIPEPHEVAERALHTFREFESLFEKNKNEYICIPPSGLLKTGIEKEILIEKKGICFSSLPNSKSEDIPAFLKISETHSFKGKIREVRSKIEDLRKEGKPKFILTSSFPAQTERLESLFHDIGVRGLNSGSETPAPFEVQKEKTDLLLVLSELRNGFVLQEENIFIWSENDIFGRAYKRKTRFKKHASRAIESFIDLREGDYVVHIHHGVGKFQKIEKVTSDNKIRDFLKLSYAGGDTLFVPLDQISLVQRYVGGSERPHLDSLGKGTWKKKKERVAESINKLALELVELYANRVKLKGFAYPPDTIWQEEFEAEFEYEETPDQLAAIEAVKSDLESSKPMDRLICGDVGYGKTEVAIRAAFKVMMAGRQVMMIAPTTILCLQHFNNLENRFKNFPLKVEMVSRFRSKMEIKEILKKFSQGDIDMIVGTHALLSPSVKPKNIGLLIIDEEQRFGVVHKEAIKKMKNLVDVLTLTATPIPRTLHMSLAGIRDLSVIETPPRDRQSVETYVMEENEDIVKAAIDKELERGGQVYYIHNRVETIEYEAVKLSRILPKISIGVLHGQLSEDEVEETLMDFYNKKYDVLVTTTIIESGIDLPNVNTMIINRADTFGLSQLYQIRGRVGRSGRKAYAYLFYQKDRALTENAEKRLNTIHEYQDLGSGFKVAMKDLEIRGAGNLLGKEQSGDIMEVGFDLYLKMLEEAVAKIKGEEIHIETRTAINLSTNFYIPEYYISDTKQKIEFYKRYEGALSIEEIEEVGAEMADRFGEPDEVVNSFIIQEKIRTLASNLGFETVSEDKFTVRFKSGEYFKGDPKKIVKLISANSGLSVQPNEPGILRFIPKSKKEKERLEEILQMLEKIYPDQDLTKK